jgi:glycosyltransferase involved in cell wall biosynthesis
VAKIVEYLGVGVPVVSTPLRSARSYFGEEPAVRFADFNGASFGDGILGWLSVPRARRRELGLAAAERVATALDWRVVARKAVDFMERTHQRAWTR